MRLVSLEIYGFKSFADPQKLVFPGGMTAVVGPNGCGKSNIADALAWVLGEQRVSMLRGLEMSDVVFAGTSERRAMGMAEAKLVLEMYDHAQPGGVNEVTVSRRLFRDSGSEYRINGRDCRLKDIQDLLMDTGMGTRAYSFIQQGQIDQLLSSKPKDRRHLLEEAAGITRYKLRRAEAERRLEDIRADLQRLDDILFEKHRQLESLKRQAAKTRRALELDREIRDAQRVLLTGKAMELESAKECIGQDLDAFRLEIAKLTAQAAEKASEAERQRMLADEMQESQGRLSRHLASIDSRLGLLEQERAHKKERAAEAGESIAKIRRRMADFDRDGGVGLLSRIEGLRSKADEAQARFDEAEAITKKADEAVALAGGSLRAVESELKSLRDKRDEAMREAMRHQEARQALSAKLSEIEGRLEALNHEEAVRAPEYERLDREIKSVLKEIEGAEARLGDMEEALAEQGRLCDAATDDLRACERRFRDAKGAVEAAELRLNQLADALKSAGGAKASEEALKWLKGKGITPVVMADALKVDECARADLERALGAWINTFAWDWEETALGRMPGRILADIAQNAEDIPHPEQTVPMMASVRWKPDAPHVLGVLLSRMFRCADEAFFGLAAGHPDFAFVSPSFVKLPFGPVQIGVERPAASPLNVTAERDALRVEREAHLDRMEALEMEKKSLAGRESEARENLRGMEEDCNAARRQLGDKQGRGASIERQIREIEEAKQRADDQWEFCEKEIEALRSRIRKMDERNIEGVGQALEAGIRDAEERRSQAQRNLDACREAHMGASNGRAAAWSERDSAERDYRYMQRGLFDLENSKKRLAEELAETEGRLTSADGRVVEIDSEVQALLKERAKTTRQHNEARPKIEQAKEALQVQERELREFQEALKNAHQLHQESTVLAAEIDGNLKAVAKEVELTLGMPIHEFLNSITEAEKDAWVQGQLVHQTRLVELQTRRIDIGSINALAIQELEDVEALLGFKNAQRADVLESMADLEATIKMINAESEDRFREAFDFINARFQEVFRQVFGGGSAYLSLQDPKDILECGIEITAQPPGKTAKVLTLLSGGEKALAAISLLFAIFHFKPSPFCVLDEVDAPLDEANVGRFAGLVKNMKEHTQFLVITHQKPTMVAADTLYGVTMEEKGVSRLVSVQLKEAEEFVR